MTMDAKIPKATAWIGTVSAIYGQFNSTLAGGIQ
jgi:hypothetical protein